MLNLLQFVNALKGGGNPDALVQQLINSHPQRDQIQQIVGGKSPDQLMSIAENMCKERGTTINDVLGQFGLHR